MLSAPRSFTMRQHTDLIADLLLGAAYADRHLAGVERDAIERRLCALLDVETLPAPLHERVQEFNPTRFDASAAAGGLAELSDAEKRTVLEWIASIHEADETLDVDEDEYLRLVAYGMGFDHEQIADLTLEIIDITDLKGALQNP